MYINHSFLRISNDKAESEHDVNEKADGEKELHFQLYPSLIY